MGKTPHTGCHRGKKVMVTLRDGRKIIDTFWERTDKYIWLKHFGKIIKSSIRAFVIYREPQQQHEMHES